jgi:hypothetical protein
MRTNTHISGFVRSRLYKLLIALSAIVFLLIAILMSRTQTDSGSVRMLFWDLLCRLHIVKPAGSGRDLVSRTSGQIKGIVIASRWYKSEYGHLPFTGDESKSVQSCVVLLDILLMRTNNSVVLSKNPRGIVFGDPSLERTSPVDPWGHPLNVIFATGGVKGAKVCGNEIAESVAIWSVGPNGRDECGNGDDIRSWP